MATIKVAQNTTALDVALNLSGSLTGFPAVLAQLPVGDRVGFAALPNVWDDVSDIGQTWTPDIQGMSLELDVTAINKGVDGALNERAMRKVPFTTDLFGLQTVIDYGRTMLEEILMPPIISMDKIPIGTNIRGWTFIVDTNVPDGTWPFENDSTFALFCNGADFDSEIPEGFVGSYIEGAFYVIGALFNETSLIIRYVDWIEENLTFTFPDDKDYIVTSNNLPTGDATRWGFENIVKI